MHQSIACDDGHGAIWLVCDQKWELSHAHVSGTGVHTARHSLTPHPARVVPLLEQRASDPDARIPKSEKAPSDAEAGKVPSVAAAPTGEEAKAPTIAPARAEVDCFLPRLPRRLARCSLSVLRCGRWSSPVAKKDSTANPACISLFHMSAGTSDKRPRENRLMEYRSMTSVSLFVSGRAGSTQCLVCALKQSQRPRESSAWPYNSSPSNSMRCSPSGSSTQS
eukprot:6191126-Amphidinium_carterae.1